MLKRIRKILKIFVLGAAGIILLGNILLFYATKIEPYLITVDEVPLMVEKLEDFRIIQISDIQISANFTIHNLTNVIETMNQNNPDLVLFTGDLYENYAEYNDDDALIEVLSSIKTKYGKYAVWGNRDYGGGAEKNFETIMRQSGFQLLRNESVSIMLDNGNHLLLAGLDDALLGEPDIEAILENLHPEENRFSILMTHEPDTADLYANIGFDLIVSGHSHGGQVSLPFLPHVTTAMAEKYVNGLYRVSEQTILYVNSGIGTSRYPVRCGVPPEIAVLYLYKEN